MNPNKLQLSFIRSHYLLFFAPLNAAITALLISFALIVSALPSFSVPWLTIIFEKPISERVLTLRDENVTGLTSPARDNSPKEARVDGRGVSVLD